MPEIGDPASVTRAEPLAHPLDGCLYRVAPTVQDIRVHIPLQCDLGADDPARFDGINAPIEPEDIITSILGQKAECMVGPFCEEC
jgi:hypothetical protein